MKKLISAHVAFLFFVQLRCQGTAHTTTSPPLNLTGLEFKFSPDHKEMGPVYQGYSNNINITFPLCEKNFSSFQQVVDVQRVMKLQEFVIHPPSSENPCFTAQALVYGDTVGLATLSLNVIYQNPDVNNPCQKQLNITSDYPVAVPRAPTLELSLFKYGTIFFLIILNFGFGCTLNLDIVRAILRRPFAPGVGFSCQYLLMPLVGFSVAKTVLRSNPLLGFGMLCSSCSPGGAGSNVWCLLLGGDVDLSLTMTFISLTASMFMMPLWLFILGRFFVDTTVIQIPYLDILKSLLIFVVPCFIGILIKKFSSRGAMILGKIIKPWSVIFILYLLSFGLYVNRYIFPIIGSHPGILLPALMQPYIGFLMAFLIAMKLARQPRYRCITIAIETGVQNVTIPMVMLQNSFEQPYGDVAAVMPVTTALFTPLPMMFAFVALTIYKKFIKKPRDEDDDETKEPLENGTVIELTAVDDVLKTDKKSKKKNKIAEDSAPTDRKELESFISEKVHQVIMKYLDKESDL